MTENPATPAETDAPEPTTVTTAEVVTPEEVGEASTDDVAAVAVTDEAVAETVVLDEAPAAAPEAAADMPEAAKAAADVPAADETSTEVPTEPEVEPEATPADGAEASPVETVPAPEATPIAVAPGPRPSPASIRPRPVPRPPTGAPSAPTTGHTPVVAPTAAAGVPAPAAPLDPAEVAAASAFGRVAEDGTVFVQDGDDEREVGQVPGATAEDAMALYVRRFLDVQAKVALFETRLTAADLSVKEIDATLGKLTEELAAPAAVGDLVGLRARLETLRAVAAERRAAAEAERTAARQAALEARTAIVEQAEQIAGTDPSRIQWRPAGEQLRLLLDQWKDAQRNGPRLDRPSEESLWKRFSHARTTFDRERRHFFAELESRNASAKNEKEALVAQAERLATSTDWAATAGAFRDLMAEWKAAGRASRPVDDALWARFRTAQDAFFQARDAASAATDEEYQANLVVKERLLTEAESLLPIKDLGAAKVALRSIQDRWDAAGKVPRGDIQRVEGRLRAVEQAVRDADQHQWQRSNPETRARAEGMGAQLEQAIAGLEADLAKARATGDARKVAEVTAALEARRSWLEQVERAARDARG